MQAPTTGKYVQRPRKKESVSLNGTKIYYEVYGKGEPLFLLHGFTQSSKSWLQYISEFDKEYEVYLVDLKGHGKSGIFTERLSIRSAAKDLLALFKYLDISAIKAIGYSYGGDILFQLALLQPDLIQSMVVIGSCGTWVAKDFPEFMDFLSMKNIKNLSWMPEQQVNDDQIRSILEQVPHYDVRLSDKELAGISARTLMVIGDKDQSLHWDDILKANNLLQNAALWVVPNTGHGAHKDHNKDQFVRVVKNFLGHDEQPVPDQSEIHMDTVKRVVDAVNDRDFKAVRDCLAENFTRHDLTDTFPRKTDGNGEAIDFLHELINAFPDIHFRIHAVFSDGQNVGIRYQISGTHRGKLFGVAPTNQKVEFSGINIYRLESGKITDAWQLWDWGGVFRQIGAINLKSFSTD